MMASAVALVIGYGTSMNLATAYGVATASAMLFTTILFILVQYFVWNVHWSLISLFAVVFLFIDGLFFVANVIKFAQGAWISLMLGGVFGIVMWIWYSTTLELNHELQKSSATIGHLLGWMKQGEIVVTRTIEEEEAKRTLMRRRYRAASMASVGSMQGTPLKNHDDGGLTVKRVAALSRAKGTGVFIDTQQQDGHSSMFHSNSSKTSKESALPAVLTSFVSRIPILTETVILLQVQYLPIPYIAEEDRIIVQPIQAKYGLYHITLRYGYQESDHNVISVLERARGMGIDSLDTGNCLFFVERLSVQHKASFSPSASSNQLRGWKWFRAQAKKLKIGWFEMINKNIDGQKEIFHLPPEVTIEVGSTVMI